MSNVLDDEKQQQVRALGRLGWTLFRIQGATGIRRETVSSYLKAAGVAVRGRGRPSESKQNRQFPARCPPTLGHQNRPPGRTYRPTRRLLYNPAEHRAPACANRIARSSPRRSRVGGTVAIWQDLVDDHGFPAPYASVRRFVVKLRGCAPADARLVITTPAGEDYGETSVMVNARGDHGTCCHRQPRSCRSHHNSYSDSSQRSRSLGRRGLFAGAAGDPTKFSASRFIVRSICTYTSVDFTSPWPRKSLIVINGTLQRRH